MLRPPFFRIQLLLKTQEDHVPLGHQCQQSAHAGWCLPLLGLCSLSPELGGFSH